MTTSAVAGFMRGPADSMPAQRDPRGLEHHPHLGQFRLRPLKLSDIDQVLALRDEVLAELEDRDLYVREADEAGFVAMHLNDGESSPRGETLGVFERDQLVAYAMLGLPAAEDADNLGRYFTDQRAELAETAHLASCMVRRPFRGNFLQRLLLTARFALARSYRRQLCVSMVSLRNAASRHNLMREGLCIGWVGEIDGLRRQLLALRLDGSWDFARDQARLVSAVDWEQQCDLTRAGWWGIASDAATRERAILFAPRIGGPGYAPR